MAFSIDMEETTKLQVLFRRIIRHHDAGVLEEVSTGIICSYLVGVAASDNEDHLIEWLDNPAILDKFVMGLSSRPITGSSGR